MGVTFHDSHRYGMKMAMNATSLSFSHKLNLPNLRHFIRPEYPSPNRSLYGRTERHSPEQQLLLGTSTSGGNQVCLARAEFLDATRGPAPMRPIERLRVPPFAVPVTSAEATPACRTDAVNRTLVSGLGRERSYKRVSVFQSRPMSSLHPEGISDAD